MSGNHVAEVERWRAARLAKLRSPDGWLSVVGLEWLERGENTIGSAESNDIVIASHDVPGGIGSIHLEGDSITLDPTPGSGLRLGRVPLDGPIPLQSVSGGRPTVVRIGRFSFFVIRRLDRFAVRIKDTRAPAIRDFRGIEHWPVEERWRFGCRFERYEPERSAEVATVLGIPETYRIPGALVFEIDGASHRLDAFLEGDEEDLFVVFGDLTNGSESFGGGRYIYTPQADDRGSAILDFNRAYNPPCVFTPHATCPLPLPQNRLRIRVEAGEKRYGDKA